MLPEICSFSVDDFAGRGKGGKEGRSDIPPLIERLWEKYIFIRCLLITIDGLRSKLTGEAAKKIKHGSNFLRHSRV